MAKLSCHGRRWRAGIVLALLAATLVAPTVALADRDDGDEIDGRHATLGCPGKETLVRIDELTCDANPHRPVVVRKRACCMNPAGRVHCEHFPHCPNESPS